MADIDWTETLKIWGSIAGLLSAVWLILEKLSAHRPIASFASTRISGDPFNSKEATLRIKNRSPSPIMIDRFWSSSPDFAASKFADHSDFFQHAGAIRARALIDSSDMVTFPLSISEDTPPSWCFLLIFWTTGSGVLPHFPIVMVLRPARLVLIEHERAPGKLLKDE